MVFFLLVCFHDVAHVRAMSESQDSTIACILKVFKMKINLIVSKYTFLLIICHRKPFFPSGQHPKTDRVL